MAHLGEFLTTPGVVDVFPVESFHQTLAHFREKVWKWEMEANLAMPNAAVLHWQELHFVYWEPAGAPPSYFREVVVAWEI